MKIQFKKCALFDKTMKGFKSMKTVTSKLEEFLKWKEERPNEQFGSKDRPFIKAGHLGGFWHVGLTNDVSLIYQRDGGIIKLFGVFTHDESGTGQPANIKKQSSLATKLDNQVFETRS